MAVPLTDPTPEQLGQFPKNIEAYLSGPVVTFRQLPEEIRRYYLLDPKVPENVWLTKTHAALEFPPDPEGRFDPPGQVDFWKKTPDGNWVLQYSGLVLLWYGEYLKMRPVKSLEKELRGIGRRKATRIVPHRPLLRRLVPLFLVLIVELLRR